MFLTKGRLRLYLGALLLLQIVTCARLLPFARAGQTDFRTFYTAGHMLRTGADLYNYDAELSQQSALVSPNRYALPFLSPPYTALLFVPLSLSKYWPAYLLFAALNLALCALAAKVMHPHLLSLNARWPPLAPLLFLSFMPLAVALTMGQLSIILLLLYCSCYAALKNSNPFLAGILLALALIKFQIAAPIALLFLLWRQWRFLAGFLTGAATLTLISILITGPRAFATYLHSLVFMSKASSNPVGEARYGMFPTQMPNLYGLFHTLSGGATWSLALTILCSLLVLFWAARQKPSLPLALLAGVLVSYHLYLYDLTLLLLPITLVFNQSINQNIDSLTSTRQSGALYASLFLQLGALWVSFVSFDSHYLVAIPVAILFVCFRGC
ncbi:MAG: glycosyltransferase family 87 protein [Edaphobacter sp.]